MPSRRAVEGFLSRIVLRSAQAPQVMALWREEAAGTGALDLHAALADPDYEGFLDAHASFLRGCGPMAGHEDEPAALGGHLCRAAFPGGLRLHFSMERASQLPKRQRRAVVPLDDKTGGRLRHVMSFAPGYEMGT